MLIMEQGLKLRKRGAFVRLDIQENCDSDILDFLNYHMKISAKDVYSYNLPLNLGALWEIVGNKNFSKLTLPPYHPKVLPPLNKNESIFRTIRKQDILLYHPYESFDPVTRLIKEAAKDSKVISIRVTRQASNCYGGAKS